jgi:hypothetical protein
MYIIMCIYIGWEHKLETNQILYYMAAGRLWWGPKYSHGVWVTICPPGEYISGKSFLFDMYFSPTRLA